jgi:hypothetical protein
MPNKAIAVWGAAQNSVPLSGDGKAVIGSILCIMPIA